MPTMITTEVFTLDELVERGDEKAVERALDWMQQAWADAAVESVTETLVDILAEAFGKNTLTWDAWDYWHGYVRVGGSVSRADMRVMDEGPLAGLSWPGGDALESFTYRHYTGAFASDVSVRLASEDTDWEAARVLREQVGEWVREVEGRLNKVMQEEYEYLTGRDYLLELAQMNECTFTVDGRRFG